MRKRVVVVAVLAALFALMAVTSAQAADYWKSSQCLGCHESTSKFPLQPNKQGGRTELMNFQVSAGNLSVALSACQKCHQNIGLAHPYHDPMGNGACGGCHGGWGSKIFSAVPDHNLSGAGYFNSDFTTLAELQSADLHAIHSATRWPKNATSANSKCANCHAAAACTACHPGTFLTGPDLTHRTHAGPGATIVSLTPWQGKVSSPLNQADQSAPSSYDTSLTCGDSRCHPVASWGTDNDIRTHNDRTAYGITSPVVRTNWPAIIGNTWEITKSYYYNNDTALSNSALSQMTLTFTGSRVQVIGDRDQFRGIADFQIDGLAVKSKSEYAPTYASQQVIFDSNVEYPGLIAEGQSHTLTVKVKNTKDPGARSTHFFVDAFKVWEKSVPSSAKWCLDNCHGGGTSQYASVHESGAVVPSGTVTPWETYGNHFATAASQTTDYGFYCTSCHNLTYKDEHQRGTSSPSTPANPTCAACHSTLVDEVWTTDSTGMSPAERGCAWSPTTKGGSCHTAARVQHHNYAGTAHVAGTNCAGAAGCHTGALTTLHGSRCLSCHTNSAEQAENETCGNAGTCHGEYLVNQAPATHNLVNGTDTSHTAGDMARAASAVDSSYVCSTCHSNKLGGISSRTDAHVNSANGSACAGATGCHNWNSTTRSPLLNINSFAVIKTSQWASPKRCDECHGGANGNAYHDTMATGHTGTAIGTKVAGGANTCAGGSCHNPGTQSLMQIHNGAIVSAAISCGTDGCHNSLNKDMSAVSKSCGGTGTTSACHDAGGTGTGTQKRDDDGHATNVHRESTTTPSAYNDTTVSGCVNGGAAAGCHGGLGTDPTAYHNACADCHDSGGVKDQDRALMTTSGCEDCHDSNFPTAPDRWTLTGAYANGHYSSATHTVNATVMGGYATGYSGVATAMCSSCHASDLYSIHTTVDAASNESANSKVTCYECHNDSGTSPGGSVNGGTGGLGQVTNKTWSSSSNKSCAICHTTSHGAMAAGHVGSSARSCTGSGNGCHQTSTDLAVLHAGANAVTKSCRDCHASQTANAAAQNCENASCHSAYYSTAHRSVNGIDTSHTASSQTGSITYTGVSANPSATCATCHSLELRTAHTTLTATLKSGATGWNVVGSPYCTQCHNTSTPDNATGVITAKAFRGNKTCDVCHEATYGNGRHTGYPGTLHNGVPTGTCTGANCHTWNDTTQLQGVHERKGCAIAQCHDPLRKDSEPTIKACGSGSGGCHTGAQYVAGGHGGDHNASVAVGQSLGSSGVTSVLGGNTGCFGCHYTDLRREHGDNILESVGSTSAAGRTMQRTTGGNYPASGNDRCGACHSDQAGTGGTNGDGKFSEGKYTDVTNAMQSGTDKRCIACHTGNGTTGPRAPHSGGTVPNTPLYTSTYTNDFVTGMWTNGGGGHRALPGLTGTLWNGGSVTLRSYNGTAYSANAPAIGAPTFVGGTGLTVNSTVMCSDCHVMNGTTGPQGATGSIQESATVLFRNATTNQIGSTVCGKCHPALDHSSHGNEYCIGCHIGIPHAWKRPRLLRRTLAITGYAADAAPYLKWPSGQTSTYGLNGFGVAKDNKGVDVWYSAGAGSTWDKAGCAITSCSGHATWTSSGTPPVNSQLNYIWP